MTAVFLYGGPGHGRVLDIGEVGYNAWHTLRMPYVDHTRPLLAQPRDPADYTPADWGLETLISSCEYRRMRWTRCGSDVLTMNGETVYEYVGAR